LARPATSSISGHPGQRGPDRTGPPRPRSRPPSRPGANIHPLSRWGSEQPAPELTGAKRPTLESGVATKPIKQARITASKDVLSRCISLSHSLLSFARLLIYFLPASRAETGALSIVPQKWVILAAHEPPTEPHTANPSPVISSTFS
jgi:hypothetical protein